MLWNGPPGQRLLTDEKKTWARSFRVSWRFRSIYPWFMVSFYQSKVKTGICFGFYDQSMLLISKDGILNQKRWLIHSYYKTDYSGKLNTWFSPYLLTEKKKKKEGKLKLSVEFGVCFTWLCLILCFLWSDIMSDYFEVQEKGVFIHSLWELWPSESWQVDIPRNLHARESTCAQFTRVEREFWTSIDWTEGITSSFNFYDSF